MWFIQHMNENNVINVLIINVKDNVSVYIGDEPCIPNDNVINK